MAGALRQIKNKELRERFAAPTLDRAALDALVRQFHDDVQAGRHRESGWGNSNYGFSKLALIAYSKLVAREEEAAGSPVKVLPVLCVRVFICLHLLL